MKKLNPAVESVVYRKRRKVDAIECDICDKLITPAIYKKDSARYFEVTTGHNDWGNDSCESVEHLDICPDCIAKFVAEYAANVDGTEYLRLETKYVTNNWYTYED